MKLKPLLNRLVIEQEKQAEVSHGGIIIPTTAKEKPQRGTVVAVGDGEKDKPMTVKVGDTIIYGRGAGTEVVLDGKEYFILRETDVFGIL